jgi:hypothetical protein
VEKCFPISVKVEWKVVSSFQISCVDLSDCFPTLGTCWSPFWRVYFTKQEVHTVSILYVKSWKLSDIQALCIVKTYLHWTTWPRYYKVPLIITCHRLFFISHTSCHNVILLLRSFLARLMGIAQQSESAWQSRNAYYLQDMQGSLNCPVTYSKSSEFRHAWFVNVTSCSMLEVQRRLWRTYCLRLHQQSSIVYIKH